ncbi:MAG: hypothetical protein HYU42_02105 [Candidatus Rokubacteria bacterium]|nr:hypothetical protein [Candidatus Rokubacteria bacterium]
MSPEVRLASKTVDLPDSPEAIDAYFVEHQWSDGLPVVPPTEARVRGMLAAVRRDPQESLGDMPPGWRAATIEKLAINAVMAGCLPSYFPVIVAAAEAMLDPAFNLYGVQATTHPVAPLLIVGGDYARTIGMHWGSGCFGPGHRANATIGRALRMILLNLGGAWPGHGDMATQGQPSKYSYAVAENEPDTPWEPLRVALGFRPEDSTVTVFGAEGPHNVNDHVSTTAAGILTNCCSVMTTLGSNVGWYMSQSQVLLVLGPEHAATIARSGFSRRDVQEFCFNHARMALRELRLGGMYGIHEWPAWMNAIQDEDVRLPIVLSPEDILVMVAGGPGKHSAVVPNCTFSRTVTRRITI